MVNTYTPAYYSSLHGTITSICKTILPFSFKKRRLAAGQKLSKQQSENLKWQQESFHRILNLIGLKKEGMVLESEVSGFRSQLLETLIASPADQEEPIIIRDKLLFLQELFYAKCISDEEYHSSKRPLIQRLAVQGAEIEARDVIIAGPPQKKIEEEDEEEWSDIDFKGEECLMGKEKSQNSDKSKHRSPMKRIKGAVKLVSPFSSDKNKGNKGETHQAAATNSSTGNPCAKSFSENPFWDLPSKQTEIETQSILMAESGVTEERAEKSVKKKKKQWGFDVGFKKWKRSDKEENLHEEKENAAPLTTTSLNDGERTTDETPCRLVSKPLGEGPDTKQIKRKIHSDGSASDFFIDKVLGDNIKKELSRIQTELCTTNPNLSFSNDQIDAISTRLPVDKADLKKFFPKSWCDRYGDIVLDVVKKEFKDHVGEMENIRNNSSAAAANAADAAYPTTAAKGDKEKKTQGNSSRWVMFDDENYHPNLFASAGQYDHDQNPNHSKCFENNPFLEDGVMKLRQTRPEEQNPFWSPSAAAAGGHI